jgi:hypothetical protein
MQERVVDELHELARSGDALRASSLDLPELRRLTIAAALAATDPASSLDCPTGELEPWDALWVSRP